MQSQPITGNFVAIPERTLRSKEWRSMSPSVRVTYQTMMLKYIRKGQQANGEVTWSQPELAKEAGVSVRTVKTSLAELRAKDWIEIKQIGCRWTPGTTYRMLPLYANGKA